MTPMELIEAAYATVVSDAEKESIFNALVEQHRIKWEDYDRRFKMTPEDLNRVYTL